MWLGCRGIKTIKANDAHVPLPREGIEYISVYFVKYHELRKQFIF
jgi:hypothetical protein